MKLSKIQKIDLLKKGIENLKNGRYYYICNAIPIDLDNIFELIPEILQYRPENTFTSLCWFRADEEGKQKRIEILEKVIGDILNA